MLTLSGQPWPIYPFFITINTPTPTPPPKCINHSCPFITHWGGFSGCKLAHSGFLFNQPTVCTLGLSVCYHGVNMCCAPCVVAMVAIVLLDMANLFLLPFLTGANPIFLYMLRSLLLSGCSATVVISLPCLDTSCANVATNNNWPAPLNAGWPQSAHTSKAPFSSTLLVSTATQAMKLLQFLCNKMRGHWWAKQSCRPMWGWPPCFAKFL